LLYSIDYDAIRSLYDGKRDQIAEKLEQEINFLLAKKPDCLVLCNNFLHKYLDMFSAKLDPSVPIFHAGLLSVEEAVRQKCKKILLLGTAFTMEDGFFAKYFQDRGIEVVIPSLRDRQTIQSIQSQLAQGEKGEDYRDIFATMLAKYDDVDAIVLACTELPLAIDDRNAKKPLIDPIRCQCKAAAEYAFGVPIPQRTLE
jgi:aspartate racemase